MSVPSELIGNTQNSFQTHAQRGANIVMRGGKKNRRTRRKQRRKSRRKSKRRKSRRKRKRTRRRKRRR